MAVFEDRRLLGHEVRLLVLVEEMLVVEEDLRRMALADDVQGLLHVLEHDFAALLEACHLHLDDLADALLIVAEILDAFIILNEARDAKVQAAEDDSLLNVLDEGKDVRVNVERVHICDVSIDEAVADAFPGIAENLVVQLRGALIYFTAFANVIDDLLVEDVHLPHSLIDLWEILDVLSRVLDHALGKWPLLPELDIVLHEDIDLVLLAIDLA